jgi:hypothetical protein
VGVGAGAGAAEVDAGLSLADAEALADVGINPPNYRDTHGRWSNFAPNQASQGYATAQGEMRGRQTFNTHMKANKATALFMANEQRAAAAQANTSAANMSEAGSYFSAIAQVSSNSQRLTKDLFNNTAALLRNPDGSSYYVADQANRVRLWNLLAQHTYETLADPQYGVQGAGKMLEVCMYTCDAALDPAPQSADRVKIRSKIHEFEPNDEKVDNLLTKWADTLTAVYQVSQRGESAYSLGATGMTLVGMYKSVLEMIIVTECWARKSREMALAPDITDAMGQLNPHPDGLPGAYGTMGY